MSKLKDVVQYAAERFQTDVQNHHMTVRHDDGLYRHLTFKQPDTNHYRFDLVTWPGYLAITGDMGDTYTFSRLEDMFEFFRSNPNRPSIDFRYWAEKLEHPTRGGRSTTHSVQSFSKEVLTKAVHETLEEVLDDYGFSVEGRALVFEEAERRLGYVDSEHDLDELRFRAADLAYTKPEDVDALGAVFFEDFYDLPHEEWDFAFIWICHAIAWGIAQYDEATAITLDPTHCAHGVPLVSVIGGPNSHCPACEAAGEVVL